MNNEDRVNKNKSEEMSFMDLITKVKIITIYIKSKWHIIVLFVLLGGGIGVASAIFKKQSYTAICTFVLEDSKGGGLGQYAGLASLAGINIGDAGGSGSIFQGENILELYKSRTMIEKTLLTACLFNGKKQLLIDRYIDSYDLRKRWKNDKALLNINFNGSADKFNRKQDSIVTDLVSTLNKQNLNVTKPDKKLNIIKVQVEAKDELFAQVFTQTLVQNVNDFYVYTKTKTSLQNVQILQHQADSVRVILNSSINGVASANDDAPNPNPLMSTLRVPSQRKQIDVQANTAIYTEIVKNLELSKISLRQQMPLIQIVDKPVLPLSITKSGKITSGVIGMIIGFVLIVIFLVCKKIFGKLKQIWNYAK